MYVALDPIGSSSKPKKTNNKTSQTIKTTQTTTKVDPLAAIAEEKRRKKIQEYKKLINDVKKANSEISESIDELVSTEKMIDKCITGEFANSIKNIIQNLQGQTETVMNNLNVIGTKAAQKVENEGEPCIYNKQQPNSEITYSGKNKTTFSCNTDVLRKQVLQGLETYKMKLAKPINSIANLPKLEGCEGVTNIPNSIDDIKKLATNLYNEVKSWIERAEQAEAENQRIVEQLGRENIDAITGAYRRPPENPNYDFAKVCKIAMEKGIEFKSGETPSEFIKRVAEELNIPTTTIQEGTFGETPWLNQLDFQEKETGLCGPTSLCMLASAALGYLYTPADLYRDFQDINKYRDGGGGFGDKLFKDEKILERLNLKLVNINGEAYYGNAWGDYSTPENGLLMEALREGKRAIWCSQKNIFTNGGHYMEVELKNDKIWINDPNGQNYLSNNSTLIDILNNGCDPEVLRQYGGRYYIFDVANKENTNGGDKSDEVLIKEILEASGYNSQNSTEEPKQVSIDESKKTDVLDSKFGKIEYVEGLYSINENETSPYYIKKYHVTAPSNLVDSEGNPQIVDPENRPTNVIVSLHGDGNVNGISGKTMADIITNSELDKPYAIIIEPELRVNETANVWGMEYNAETIKSIIDNVNEVFGLSIKDITYTIIRI